MRALMMMCVVSVCVLVGGVSGCKPKQSKEEKQAAQAEALRLEVEAQFAEILALQSRGKTAEAMALLEKCLANKKFNAYRPGFFTQKIDLLLAQDNVAEASQIILEAWAKEPNLAMGTYERVYTYHNGKSDHEAVIAWCKQLTGVGKGEALPKWLYPKIMGWHLTAALALDDMAVLLDAVDHLVACLEPKVVVSRVQPVVHAMIGAGKFEQASALIAHLASHRGGEAQEYKDFVATANLQNLLAQKDWAKVPGAFEVCVAQLQDDVLLALLRQTVVTLNKNQQHAMIEKISHDIFLTAVSKTLSANEAARLWLNIGMQTDKRVLPDRLVALLDAKVQAEQIAMLFEQHFYALADDRGAIKTLCAIGERIMKACSDEKTAQELKRYLMDGAGMLDDFDLALTLLESGIPDQSPEWHEMAIPKIKAHRAEAQGKPLEAIAYFREFMNVLADRGPEEEPDPRAPGVVYSKEWLLGFNAHRIANLYEKASDPANAAKAREEAKAFFTVALEKASKDEDTLRMLKKEMKEMGL